MDGKNSKIQLLVIVLVTILGTFFFAHISFVLNMDVFPDSLLSIWNTWDTQHYLNIAKDGYSSSTENDKHLLIAFFPLYPLLIKIFSFIFQSYLLSGLLVSNIAYALAAYYLYKLVRIDFNSDDALRAVIYFSIFPTAYILHAAYTESLFLALSISSFYYARNSRWAVAGILGMLAAMTRVTGILLLPIMLFEYLHQKEFKRENIGANVIWVLIIAAGFFIYLIVNYITFGDPLKFLEVQSGHWTMNLSTPIAGLINSWDGVVNGEPGFSMTSGWFQIVFAALGYVLIIFSFFRLRLSYSLYALLTWLVVTSTSFWLSLPRFLVVIFPIYIVLALLGRRKEINYCIIFISLILYALLLFQFVRFRWVF